MAPVTIASRDSIVSVIEDIGWFDLVFVDEAHNIAPGETTRYRKIINTLKGLNPNLHVIGFTATPFRTGQGYIYGSDEKHLFQGVACEIRIKRLIEEKHLCPVTARAVSPEAIADTSKIKTTAGDFNQNQLETVLADDHLIDSALTEWERLAFMQGRKSTVFFCVSVLHAQLVSEDLLRRGYDVPIISGTTPQKERDKILTAFDRGELVGIANVGVLTEGWDCPRLDCICLLRPTKSLGLYIQMVGRGLRNFPGKDNCLILDFGECIQRFGPIDIAQPVSRKQIKDPRTKTCPECQTIHGFLKRKCPCGYRFEEEPSKECTKCGESNAPSATRCVACGEPFVTHQKKSMDGDILSDGIALKNFSVDEISCQVRSSRNTGRDYLQILYRHDLFTTFSKNLMLGYPGYAGEKAQKEWLAMTLPESPVPANPREGEEMESRLRPVLSITVDTTSKWKEIVSFEYGNMA